MPTPPQPPLTPLKMDAQQHLGVSQRLLMTAHMQQAIRLLQIPLQELNVFIEEQVALNPLLEVIEEPKEEGVEEKSSSNEQEYELTIDENDLSILSRLEEDFKDHFEQSESPSIQRNSEEDKLKNYVEQSIFYPISLREYLNQTARDTFEKPEDLDIAEILIGYLDQRGFLSTPLHEICQLHHFSEEKVKQVLSQIQTFEPYGIGATSVQEALLIQLRCLKKEHTLAYQIVHDHYDALLHHQIPLLQKHLKRSCEEIQDAIDHDIATLNLHPATHFSSYAPQAIIPDVKIKEEGEQLVVSVDRDYVLPLRYHKKYLKMLEDPSISKETKHFIKHHLLSARWLMRNLQQRYSTLERIVQVLARRQRSFFMSPDGQLVPLTMKEVAEELQLHESTIARTVSNKYVDCAKGLLPLRQFFTTKYTSEEGHDLSSSTVKQKILDLISQEDKHHPLSDEKMSKMLKNQGIVCARRTVAKYRLLLQIGNTQQRKRFS